MATSELRSPSFCKCRSKGRRAEGAQHDFAMTTQRGVWLPLLKYVGGLGVGGK